MFRIITLFACILHFSACDWVSEWMTPIKEQIRENTARRTNKDFGTPLLDDDSLRMVQVDTVSDSPDVPQGQIMGKYSVPDFLSPKGELPGTSLKIKLEATLQNARTIAETLRVQIRQVIERENTLKDAIANGRSGVTAVLVTPIDREARSYLVREGAWTLCNGLVQAPQYPASAKMYNEVASQPKCLGVEVPSQPDSCAFNSVIKYETVPTVRRMEYSEDDFFCLKQTFNSTLERYMSVPRQVINDTCQNGVVRSLEDNNVKCGIRVLSEYTYYPFRGYSTGLPLEYCAEPDGACKLLMAWHVSNTTVENFEFLKNEQGFKKYFVKSDMPAIEHVI